MSTTTDFWVPPKFPMLLPSPPPSWNKEPVVMASPARPIRRTVEVAGRAYHNQQIAASGVVVDDDVKTGPAVADADAEMRENEQLKRLRDDVDLGDYYALLGLEENFEVSVDEIKKQYRKVSLFCHPDKAPIDKREKAETVFKAMQKAYETLIDPNKRRIYESSLDFNDSIPSSDAGIGDEFYNVYGPVFKQNARFSVNRPVPDLGDPTTPYHKVNAFYDFWFAFKSWRDFAHLNEHTVEDADSREEKRWMEKQNEKKKAGEKKQEMARVRRLAEQAIAKDPRVRAKVKEDEAKKDEAKKAKLDKKKQLIDQENAAKQAVLDAKESKRLSDEEERKIQRAQTEKLKRLRASFRKGCKSGIIAPYDVMTVEQLVVAVDAETLERLALAMDTQGKPVAPEAVVARRAVYEAEVHRLKYKDEDRKLALEEARTLDKMKARKDLEAAKVGKIWSDEEISMLAKAVAKFPGGAQHRWEMITDMINTIHHEKTSHRTEKEVIKKAKEIETAAAAATSDERAFKRYKEQMAASAAAEEAKKALIAAGSDVVAASASASTASAPSVSATPSTSTSTPAASTTISTAAVTPKPAAAKPATPATTATATLASTTATASPAKAPAPAKAPVKAPAKVAAKKAATPAPAPTATPTAKPAKVDVKQPAAKATEAKKAGDKQAAKGADAKQAAPKADGKKDAKTADAKKQPAATTTPTATTAKSTDAKSPVSSAQPTPAPAKKAAPSTTTQAPAPAAVTATSAPSSPAGGPAESPSDWTPEEQLQLERALRSVPKDVEGDRWEKIAALIDGKTKADVVKRFKAIRAAITSHKPK